MQDTAMSVHIKMMTEHLYVLYLPVAGLITKHTNGKTQKNSLTMQETTIRRLLY